MNINEWAKRDDLQLEWKKSWETIPALKQGLELLKDVALPAESKIPDGFDPIQFNALANSRREGYYDALRNIEALKEIKRPSESLPGPWEETKKEE
ncbi:MAG: hypothetical protein EBS53_03760 [Bacteroidetes bacterium]|nr:hypothetical protein [Bacteroidota bacterium]